MLDLGRQGLTTASVGKKGGWVDEAAKGGNTRARRSARFGSQGAVCRAPCSCIDATR